MKNKALLDEIAKHNTIIDYHLKRLKKKPEDVHELDIDLLVEKIREMYKLVHELPCGKEEKQDKVIVTPEPAKAPLQKIEPEPEIPAPKAPQMQADPPPPLPADPPPPEPVAEKPEPEPVAEKPEPEPEAELPVEEEKPSPPAEIVPPEIKAETRIEPEAVTEQEPKPEPEAKVESPPPPAPEPPAEDPPKTTADLFSGTTTIADSFQAKEDNSIAANVNPGAVQDLKLAIGINDKFLFINELFKGDPGIYNEAVENLNASANAGDATEKIESYRQEYAWADNSEAYHRLKKITLSKFNA